MNRSAAETIDRPRTGPCTSRRRAHTSAIAIAVLWLVPAVAAVAAASDADRGAGEGVMTVDVVSDGWHTAIVLPITPQVIELCPPLAELASYRTVKVSWGDEQFYRARSVGVAMTVRAIAWPSPSVVHVVGLRHPTEEEYESVQIVRLSLPPSQLATLVASIAREFAEERSYAQSHSMAGRYFRGSFPYHFPRTCNEWTLRKLSEAGFPTSPFFGLRAEVALHQVARFGEAVRLEPREGKWPYALGSICAAGWIIGRSRRRRSAHPKPSDDPLGEPDPESASEDSEGAPSSEEPGPAAAWGIALGSMAAMLIFTVLATNGHGWASPSARAALVVMTGALTTAAFRSWSRCARGAPPGGTSSRRSRPWRVAHAIGGAVALLATAVILSPM